MLTVQNSHKQYQNFVETHMDVLYIQTNQHDTLFQRQNLIIKFWQVDLTKIIDILKPLYSKTTKGAPPKDAIALFRSLLLMTETGEISIAKWVSTLHSEPFYAILSGFIPTCCKPSEFNHYFDSLPGVGTFYDFMKKLIRADRKFHKSKLKKFRRKPKKKGRKNQKANEPKSTLTERIVKRVLKYDDTKLPDTIETTLNIILKEVFVKPSLSSGLLGDINNFNIAADGTLVRSHTSHFGKKVCDCKLKPGEKCNCHRKFTDPDATWGWDSFHEAYVYGHTFHGFTACGSKYDLPLHIKSVSAARHDSITGIYHLKELIDSYSDTNIHFYSACYDSAYDFTYFYILNEHYTIAPVIDLNKRCTLNPESGNSLVQYDDKGIPHTAACGKSLRNWGIINKSNRRKWLFPVQCNNCNKCSIESKKSYYQPLKSNPRYFCRILRGSEQWKSLYSRRSTTERVWDRLKNDFNAEHATVFSRELITIRMFLGAFCTYIDAWFKESKLTLIDIFPYLKDLAA